MAKKTWGREVALCGLLVWGALTYKLFFKTPPEDVQAYTSIYSSVSYILWAVAGTVFGFTGIRDSLNKRLSGTGKDEYVP